MTLTLSALQKQRRDTAANWTAENPTLLAGEIGIEADTGKIKIGNGSTAWASLGYQGIIPASGAYPLNQLIMPLGTAGAPTLTFTGDTNTGLYSPGADQLALATGGTGRLFVDASGRVYAPNSTAIGPGTSTPTRTLQLSDTTGQPAIKLTNDTSGHLTTDGADLTFTGTNLFITNREAGAIVAEANGSERVRIDSSGRLLVGTSSSVFGSLVQSSSTGGAQYEGARFSADSFGPTLTLIKSRGASVGTNAPVQQNDVLGIINFRGANGSDYSNVGAQILAEVDGEPFTSGDTTDLPTRLVFSTTADGASTPTERMRITNAGYSKHSNTGVYNSSTSTYHEFRSDASSSAPVVIDSTNTSYAGNGTTLQVYRAANSAYRFLTSTSDAGGTPDTEFVLRGDGNAFADGTWSGGGADYAEYFEWSDSNPDAEDRRGISVVLDGDKIREAVAGEDPIGVISGNPSVVGDAAWNKWSGKYLRDEFGTYIQEDYEVTDDDGNTVIQQRRKLNPAYDPDVEYISREQRPEWDCVGLMGKLRIRKGQITGSRWIKMRDINDSVEEWLVR